MTQCTVQEKEHYSRRLSYKRHIDCTMWTLKKQMTSILFMHHEATIYYWSFFFFSSCLQSHCTSCIFLVLVEGHCMKKIEQFRLNSKLAVTNGKFLLWVLKEGNNIVSLLLLCLSWRLCDNVWDFLNAFWILECFWIFLNILKQSLAIIFL